METMYERIKRMTKEEMSEFIYLVYLCGKDDETAYGYFGNHVLSLNAKELMPNDSIEDLYKSWNIN